ncbi:cation transporting atpase [Holotrichia oblita]|nr:cation transporting atpase [Holotrichia oblita]
MIDMNVVAARLSNARREKGFTQEELAVRLGITSQAISKWERALSLPDIDLLLDVSKILDVSINFLIDTDIHEAKKHYKAVYDIPLVNLLEDIHFEQIRISFGFDIIPVFTEDYLQEFMKIRHDIMVLSSGNQICTDAVLRKGMLEVNESLLTGESDTIVKNPGDFLYSGSYVISGRAYAQVEHVGADNFAQKITSEAKTEKRNPSELRKAMDWILKIVSIIIVPLGIGLFVIQYYTANTSFADSIIGMVAAVIGMLPEGLVLLTSIALAVGAVNLGRRDVLVHELFCIETLARVDMLCLDKTGTITEGKMQVEDVITLSDNISVNEIMGNIVYVMQDDNSTFQAFKAHFTPCNSYQANLIIPFSSARKYSGAVFEEIGTYIMGAFEFLFSEDAYPEIKEQVNKSATEGIRVITLAHSPHIAEGTNLPPELEPCALILISDIIRENAEETFRYFAEQDVQLMIISGDHPATVSKVAARAGFSGAQEFVDASTLRTTEEIRKRIPKVLFSDDYFRELSSDAKILYGLMLDRMGLSMKNGWFDEENKVYIIFTLEQVMECLNCGKDKGVKILAELDSNKGIGLIERKKQGLGKPTLIYVKNFIVQERQSSEKPKSADEERRSGEITEKEDRIDKESMSAVVSRIQEFGKIGVQTSEKPKSGVVENRSQEFGKTDTNNNNITNTDFTNTNLINQSELHEKQSHDMIWKDVAEAYTKIIHENIEYPCLIRDYRQGDIDELVDLMLEVKEVGIMRNKRVCNKEEEDEKEEYETDDMEEEENEEQGS